MGTTQSTNLDLKASLLAANTTFSKLMMDTFKPRATNSSSIYAQRITGAGLALQMDMLGPTPIMKKWVGPRIETYLRAYKYTINLDKYESSLWIDRHTLQYDKTGAIEQRMRDYVTTNANNFWDKFGMSKLQANSKCYDGVSLISASHPHGSEAGATWSNYSTNALNKLNYQTAVENGLALTLENGEPANVNYTHMMVGPKSRDVARRLLEAVDRVMAVDHQGKEVSSMAADVASVTNIYRGELDLIVDPRITGSTYQYYWYLIDASAGQIRPIIIMESMAPQAEQRQDPEDERVWSLDQYGWGIKTDTAFAPGSPWSIYGAFATTGGF